MSKLHVELLTKELATCENNGGKTGWPPGLLQDDSKQLSKWLAGKPDAFRLAREAAKQYITVLLTVNKDD